VELRHLRYFVAVAEELHFRHAAERLHVAQPAVSEQVRKLEAELGVKLLERSQRSVSLTVAGAAMLEEARRVLQQADLAVKAAHDAGRREAGRLRVGYQADALPASLLRALPHFAAAAPGIELTLRTGRPSELVEAVRHASLDVALVSLPAPAHGLRVAPLAVDRAIVALPAAHPRSEAGVVRPEQVAGMPLVLLPRSTNPAFYDAVLGAWQAAGVSPAPVEATEPFVEQALLAVAAGGGIGVLLESAAVRHAVAGVRFVPLEPDLELEVAAVTHEEPSTAVTALLGLSRRAVEQQRRAVASA
jgi:DNA-binding transcriptional LysR family regulator